MKISGLWRYPVKSMIGERRDRLELTQGGVEGDRRFGVLDLRSGTIVSAKNDGRLLLARAMLAGVTLTIRLPTGETLLGTGPAVDLALSDWLGRPVRLVEVSPTGRGTFEMPSDFEDDESVRVRWEGPYGSFVDERAGTCVDDVEYSGAGVGAAGPGMGCGPISTECPNRSRGRVYG